MYLQTARVTPGRKGVQMTNREYSELADRENAILVVVKKNGKKIIEGFENTEEGKTKALHFGYLLSESPNIFYPSPSLAIAGTK